MKNFIASKNCQKNLKQQILLDDSRFGQGTFKMPSHLRQFRDWTNKGGYIKVIPLSLANN